MTLSRDAWALRELDLRTDEGSRFPVEPERDTPEWDAFSRMKRQRWKRRRAMNYSRATANALVARAAMLDGVR